LEIIEPPKANPIKRDMVSKAADKLLSQASKIKRERIKFKKERKKLGKVEPLEAF
jgi:predicted transcriptional regulator